MSNVWFTSDLHIGHELVAVQRFQPSQIDGPAAIAWHDATLARVWDGSVGKDDQVWVLGDLSAGGPEATAYALNWIADRPGTKHLVPGNHCPVHPMYRDAHRWQSAYQQVFASVQPFARRKIAGRSVLLSHFPYAGGGDHTTDERYTQYRLQDEGLVLLHGHTHSAEKVSWVGPAGFPLASTLQIHVGVDAWEMRPVHLDEVAVLIEESHR